MAALKTVSEWENTLALAIPEGRGRRLSDLLGEKILSTTGQKFVSGTFLGFYIQKRDFGVKNEICGSKMGKK